jgi:hypothetical protein
VTLISRLFCSASWRTCSIVSETEAACVVAVGRVALGQDEEAGDEPVGPSAPRPTGKPVDFDKAWLEPYFADGPAKAALDKFREEDWEGAEAAFLEQRRYESGDLIRVGVDAFVDPNDPGVDTLVIDDGAELLQRERISRTRADRDEAAADENLAETHGAALGAGLGRRRFQQHQWNRQHHGQHP